MSLARRCLAVITALSSCAVLAAPAEQFDALLDRHWQHSNAEQVFFRKDPDAFRMQGNLPSYSGAARERRRQFNEEMLGELEAIDASELAAADQLSYAVFRYERLGERASYKQPDHLFPFTNRSSWQSYFFNAPDNMSFLTRADFDNYLVSLAQYPRYNAENIALMQQAVAAGMTQHCASMAGFEQGIAAGRVQNAKDSALYKPFLSMPPTIDARAQQALRERGEALIATAVMPAVDAFLAAYRDSYAPACREGEGVSSLPGGVEYYDYLVAFYTTTDMTAREIHDLGLAEVARIRSEMQSVIDAVGFSGSFAEFLAFLRSDPRFYAKDPEDMLEKVSRIAKRMDGQLPRLFATLPRNTYDVKPVPADVAERTTGAYYVPSPGDGRTPGTYFINTSLLPSRPLYTLEALSLHEAVPGHHLQSAIAQEADVPPFRRFLNHSAYTEGWGLYSEWLGLEAGFYTDPYSNFGRLTYEMWRACRLVVDTGLHQYGWTRQRAIDYLAGNTALSLHAAAAEVDRYITWPGQALAYKIGELKIKALRSEAEQALGAAFDVREFHDVVLATGSVPLAVLEEQLRQWIGSTQP